MNDEKNDFTQSKLFERMNNFKFIVKKPDGTEQTIEREKPVKKSLQK